MTGLRFDRRAALTGASAAMLAALDSTNSAARAATAAVTELGKAAGPVTITGVETFDIQVPQPPGRNQTQLTMRGGTPGRANVTRVKTSAGLNGYSFMGNTPEEVAAAGPVLSGQNLFAVDALLPRGLAGWPSIEEAMWDAIGRVAGQPLCRLMGGAKLDTMPVYFTYVWPGAANQEQVTPAQQAEQAKLVRQAGFKAMKIRIFRRDTMVDVEAVAAIIAAGGPGFRCMVDRTATSPGLWTYDQALAAAHALGKVGCYWLEEPLARDDFEGPARLRKEAPEIIITGGEGWKGLAPFRKGLEMGTYAIMQPEMRTCAGPLTMRKIGALCEAFNTPIAPHASSGLALAGRLQVSAAMGSLIQEIGVLSPPNLPDDVSAPFLPILHGEQPYKWRDGEAIVPQYPGLGLNIDEQAVDKFRVAGFERRRRRPSAPARP
jgi:L-alanine-DL-glutamate epimerase-like enolase superfamily enzyme